MNGSARYRQIRHVAGEQDAHTLQTFSSVEENLKREAFYRESNRDSTICKLSGGEEEHHDTAASLR
jgi:hypothetical protein